eukprot:SAG11_NODE_2219_length_3674_cov_3.448951_3_plen_173_part_00
MTGPNYSIECLQYWRISCAYHDTSLQSGRDNLRTKIIQEVHNSSLSIHLGRNRTIAELQRRVYWPNMSRDVCRLVEACILCNQNKIDRRKPQGLLRQLEMPIRPGTHYSTYIVTHLPKSGPHEYTAIFVICDRFSKRIGLIPTWDACTGPMLAELFTKHIISNQRKRSDVMK